MVPSCAHRETGIRGKIQTEAGKIIGEQKENRYWNDRFTKPRAAQRHAQSLWNRADHVDVVGGNVRKDCAGAENVQKGNQRSRDPDGPRQMAARIARLSCKDRGVFETAKRAKAHLAEDA